MDLSKIRFKSEYRSLLCDISKEFLIPALSQSTIYERSVGFFSSSSLSKIAVGINSLVNNGGHIHLVASPYLSSDDLEAIRKGYNERNSIVIEAVKRQMVEAVAEEEKERLNYLANLISDGILDIKIAITDDTNKAGMYHEKMGIMSDGENTIAFSGSMNESVTAFEANYETIDVFCSWKNDFELERVNNKKNAFTSIWNNTEPNITIIDFPDLNDEIIRKYQTYDIDDYTKISFSGETKKRTCIPVGLNFYDYQTQAIDKWEENKYVGIFDMATGTGKTYTALGAIDRISRKHKSKLAVVIVCPYIHLVDQWVEDMYMFGLSPIIGHSNSPQGDYKTRLRNAIVSFNCDTNDFICFICTNSTFKTNQITNILSTIRGDKLLVVDEAHNAGAESFSFALSTTYKYRLALSATFERFRDEEGTQRLYDFFGEKCITYSLDDAIQNNFLSHYRYYPIFTTLSDSELEEYSRLTREIKACYPVDDKSGKKKLSEKAENLIRQRARLVAGAINKAEKLEEIMRQYKNDSHILVYCGATKLFNQPYDEDIEGIRQIDYITNIMGNKLDMRVAQFTSQEDGNQRAKIKSNFSSGDELQAIIAIKCLDEGVNIPNIDKAFILASTTNPKEYIQRRGRVLRLSKGKEYAIIYDFITLPRSVNEARALSPDEIQDEKCLVKNELIRLREFARLSDNAWEFISQYDEIKEIYDLYDYTNDDYEDAINDKED